jgi:two-component system cell cycle response regulator
MMVLLAEDDAATRRLLAAAVESFGHQVALAADGRQAWEMFTQGDFNFVITDWLMPGLDGLELCRRIRVSDRPSYVYVIIVTSCRGQEDFITGMSAGADDFIIKPLNRRELQVRMRAAERVLHLEGKLRERNQQLEAVNARLQRLSRLDALMQLGNRLAFEERITEFHHRALRYGDRYGVILCDVDHFKAYNDYHGHLAGDEVLRRIAGAIQQCLRGSDAAFRYGGEEVLALLPRQSFPEALRTAERLRAQVESLRLPRLDAWLSPWVTISCGVAAYPLEGQNSQDWETVIEWADQALYRAKAQGRNRVELAEVCRQVQTGEPARPRRGFASHGRSRRSPMLQ